MTNQSEFDVTTPRVPAPRRGAFVAALLLGLILGGGLTALWAVYGSASLKEPPADVAASSSNETAQAIKDLQATQQKIAGQLQSSQQTLESEQAEIKQALASEQADTKRLSDQVTGLSGKLDAFQQFFARAQQQQSSSEPPTAAAKRRR